MIGVKYRMNENLGFYICDGKTFLSKIEACIYSTQNKKPIKWIFNNHVFDNIDWTSEPDQTLDWYYDKRARELRERYDYIILSFSGGADSSNIAESFLRQGLFIDEILVNTQVKADKISKIDPSIKESWNWGAELVLTTFPKLQEIKNKSPNTKITIVDVTDQLFSTLDPSNDISWIFDKQEVLNVGGALRFNYLYYKDIRNNFDKDKKIAIITGTDKPITYIKDNKFYIVFSDKAANLISIAPHISEYNNATVENFYWHPDCALMLAKQAHVVRKWLMVNPQYIKLWTLESREKFRYSMDQMQRLLKDIIYTTWNDKWFQVKKPILSWHCEIDSWFYDTFKNTAMHETWKRGINYVEKNASDYVIKRNGFADDLEAFSNTYYVGNFPTHD